MQLLKGSLLASALSLFASVALAGPPAPCALQPVGLSCEYLAKPAGLDVSSPRLSWKLTSAKGQSANLAQQAYQIMVASDQSRLESETADLWGSGWVKSDHSQSVAYGGKPLESGQVCWWRVRVKDAAGRPSAWSAPAQWSMGLLSPGDWKAKWIGTDMRFERKGAADNTLPDPWLRKGFRLETAPKRAVCYVASVGYHELYVNGRKVGDAVLAPAATDHTKRARYITYDITEFLARGENVIGLWLGFSWSIFPPYQTADKPASPIVIAQAELSFPGGETREITTDESWEWSPSPNTTLGVWDFMHFGGELYDARKEDPDWCRPGAKATGGEPWRPVKVFQPKLVLSAQKVQPNTLARELKALSLEEPRPGIWRVDMGKVFSGWIEIPLAGSPGDKIQIKWSERPDKEMTHELRSAYVIGPSGKGVFRNRFNYGVGRWIQIEGLKEKPALDGIRGWLVRTDYEPAGSFRCSNDLLNRIFDTVLWTYEDLSLGGYLVDCAQRERMGYGGDAHATTATGMDAFHTAALYSKWAEDWRDVQGKAAAWGVNKRADELGSGKQVEPGNLPYTAPTYWGGGGPGWSGYCVTLPWEMYRRYGDRRIVEQMLPTIEAWLNFLETKARDNLIRRYGGQWDFLGDWLWPGAEGVNGDTRETLFFNNCYWVYNLQTAAALADAVGNTGLGSKWRQRARAVREAIHREFYNSAEHGYVNNFQAYLALALIAGVPPEAERAAVFGRLENEITVKRAGHFWAGITGGSFVVRELIESNRPDLMYTMGTQEDYPGWGDMLKRGATTIWEDWEGKLSLCHSSYLHIGAWFIEGLGGIRPGADGAGYKDFILRPGIWEGCPLTSMECRFDSPYGVIESRWRRDGGALAYDFVVPPNTMATAFLPDLGGKVRVLRSQDGEQPKREATVAAYRLGPGRHSFRSSP